jgi:hypothetical protein
MILPLQFSFVFIDMKMRIVGAVREPPLQGIYIFCCDQSIMTVSMKIQRVEPASSPAPFVQAGRLLYPRR